MVEHIADPAADTADAVSNAVVTPEASLFLREILEKALTNPAGMVPRWFAHSWAMLANILMNDYLNGWNSAGPAELRKAEDAVHNALALNPNCAFAYHAQGLIHRAKGEHEQALDVFQQALGQDFGLCSCPRSNWQSKDPPRAGGRGATTSGSSDKPEPLSSGHWILLLGQGSRILSTGEMGRRDHLVGEIDEGLAHSLVQPLLLGGRAR